MERFSRTKTFIFSTKKIMDQRPLDTFTAKLAMIRLKNKEINK